MATCKECLHYEKCATPRGNTRYYNKALAVNGDVTSLCEWFIEKKKGQWLPQILLGERVWDRSECKTLGSPQWKWCPVCGARMDGDKDG